MGTKEHSEKAVTGERRRKTKLVFICIFVGILLLTIAVLFIVAARWDSRTENYTETSGSAGLNASIDYACKDDCDRKYDFNVYIFTETGQQFGTFRPDEEGKVQLALAEGEYVILIGKKFGDNTVFPQEPIEVKQGQTLDLRLRY